MVRYAPAKIADHAMRELHNYWVALSLDEALRVKTLFKLSIWSAKGYMGPVEKKM